MSGQSPETEIYGTALANDGGNLAPEVGEIVALSSISSQPEIFVLDVDSGRSSIRCCLLADLDADTITLLNSSTGDRQGRRRIAETLDSRDDLTRLSVPLSDVSAFGSPGIQGCAHPERRNP